MSTYGTKESTEQALVFKWAEYMTEQFPELEHLYHIPNGGSRNKLEAYHLKQQGVKSGVPDLHLPVPRGKYHSLYIEMKVNKNKPTDNQLKWHDALRKYGNRVEVCYSFEEAQKVLLDYLKSTRVD